MLLFKYKDYTLIWKGKVTILDLNLIEKFKEKLTILYIEITSKCNLKCRYCYNDSGVEDTQTLPFRTFKEFIISARKDLNVSTLILSGGEPFLHPQFDDMCYLATEQGFALRVYTNGTLLNVNSIKRIIKHNPIFQITLDSASYELNDFYKGAGSYKKIIKGLQLLRNEYTMDNVIVRCNLNYELLHSKTGIMDYIELLEKLDVRFAYFSLINQQGRAKACAFPTKWSDMAALEEFREHVLTSASGHCVSIDVPIVGVCHSCPYSMIESYRGDYMLHITPDGSVYPCSALAYSNHYLGNVIDNSMSDILSGDKMEKFIQNAKSSLNNHTICHDCQFRTFCGRGCISESRFNSNGLCKYRKLEISRLLREKVNR